MSENNGLRSSVSPLSEPFELFFTDKELVSMLRGVKVDVHELNLRCAVGGEINRDDGITSKPAHPAL